ncbi:hypothetical protein RN001_000816 [Aquatica leii]|uniref:Uncharacterized protein n=1 Tax=Aquatica leii TaxID=1421715 RepID=A0AAN7PAK7_9COLE|nr:hypothetical protein RN001_000816 [Aquatica leii]
MRNTEEVQNVADNLVGELEKKKQILQKKLSAIGKLDLLINVLTYKIFETQHEYRKRMEELCLEKESVLTKRDIPNAKIAITVAEIEKKMNDLRNMHEENLASLEGQRNELRIESANKIQHMDATMDSLKIQHNTILNELETSKLTANPTETAEINRRILELNKMYQKDIEILNQLQIDGWKDYDQQEKIAELLEHRGLRVTPSGNFLTKSGNCLTKSEASCLGLLEGLSIGSWSDFLKRQKEFEGIKSPPSSTTTEVSEVSKMDSDDVQYLKTVFGKPLSLALAQISAKQPRDPIHYLGHWLFKYRYNQEISQTKKNEIQELINERERLEKEKLNAILEEEARAAVFNMIIRAEEEAIRNELERIARETMAMMVEDEGADSEARDVLGVYDGPSVGR